jgi:hypothetical protein
MQKVQNRETKKIEVILIHKKFYSNKKIKTETLNFLFL